VTNVIGPDVSFYQDDPSTARGIHFNVMRNAGARYVIIRAGQNRWNDRDIVKNWRAAKEAGLLRGSYWFYDSRVDPKDQADLWTALMQDDPGELPLWCDFEDNYGGAFKGWKHWYNFMERIKVNIPGKELGVYTAYYYWLDNMVGAPLASIEYFKQYPLWIARYNASVPLIPKPWTEWMFWQYTDNGDGPKYGVESGNIDLNYFNGDEKKFINRFGVGTISTSKQMIAVFDNHKILYKEI
jgi:lysozyme